MTRLIDVRRLLIPWRRNPSIADSPPREWKASTPKFDPVGFLEVFPYQIFQLRPQGTSRKRSSVYHVEAALPDQPTKILAWR